jgi:uncharacterized protein (DUF58 family)
MADNAISGIVIPDTAALIRLRHSARELSLFPSRLAQSAMGGNYRSRFRGRGMDFDEVRPYQPGDDIRTIDWRVTARTTAVHTKVFREERERPVLIATDLRSSMFFGSQRLKSLVACDVAAALAWAGLNANDRVGGLVFSPSGQRDSRGRKNRHAVLQIFQHLSSACEELLTPAPDQLSLADILEDLRRVATPGATLVLISDFHDLDRHCEKHLFELVRHCDVTLCQVIDALEAELPPPGSYAVTDGEQTLNLDTRSTTLRQSHASAYRQRQLALVGLGKRLGIPILTFTTDQPVLPVLARAYGKNGRRRTL